MVREGDAGIGSERPRLSDDALTHVIKAVRGDDINFNAEEVLQIEAQADEIEEGAVLLKLNEKIDVTICPVLAPDDRSEDADRACSVFLREAQDLRAFFILQCGEGDHPTIVPQFEPVGCGANEGGLPDAADRTIVAAARVRGLRLVTSDQRIIESGLVRVVE